ncbi:Alpha/beta hydrolase fold [Parasponia andersonii]|uniref:Alpha/beta hydrolase fold n=1 Tax=Parasponia andersonii TaxID=3476 RepID=A0A2P5DY53_PARAD|nr:Alpha/beta hydrolase fold [Parasponia andersonii]
MEQVWVGVLPVIRGRTYPVAIPSYDKQMHQVRGVHLRPHKISSGFCVGFTAWHCYHEFLANFSTKANCVIIFVNYRLAPEHRLLATYEDDLNALIWIKYQAHARANIAYHVTMRLADMDDAVLRWFWLKAVILIQPFFGEWSRTWSEKRADQPLNSALTLSLLLTCIRGFRCI